MRLRRRHRKHGAGHRRALTHSPDAIALSPRTRNSPRPVVGHRQPARRDPHDDRRRVRVPQHVRGRLAQNPARRQRLRGRQRRDITLEAERHPGILQHVATRRELVGESVLFIHSQANRDTRPHLIGGHGDWVWETGKFDNPPQKNLETWFVRGGSAGVALYTFRQPGVYAYVNHNLIEAMELGAAGHVMVEGEWDDDLMKQVKAPGPITAEE